MHVRRRRSVSVAVGLGLIGCTVSVDALAQTTTPATCAPDTPGLNTVYGAFSATAPDELTVGACVNTAIGGGALNLFTTARTFEVVAAPPGSAVVVNGKAASVAIPALTGTSLQPTPFEVTVRVLGRPGSATVSATSTVSLSGISATTGAYFTGTVPGEVCPTPPAAGPIRVDATAISATDVRTKGIPVEVDLCPQEDGLLTLLPPAGETGQQIGALRLKASDRAETRTVRVRAKSAGELIGRRSVRLVISVTPRGDGAPARLNQTVLVRITGAPALLPKPLTQVTRSGSRVRLTVRSFMPSSRFTGRTAVIERRLGRRWTALSRSLVPGSQLVVRTINLRADRAGGPTGVSGVTRVQVRVRLLGKGAQVAVPGTPTSVALPR